MSNNRAVYPTRQRLVLALVCAGLLTAGGCAYNEPASPLIGAAGGAGLGAVIGNQVRGGKNQELWTLGGAITGLALGTTYYLTRERDGQRYGYSSGYNSGYNPAYQPPPPAPVYSTPYPPPGQNYYYSGY